MILACELCAYDDRLLFRYATADLFREHLELVHGVRLDDESRALKPTEPADITPKPEPSIVTPKPRRP